MTEVGQELVLELSHRYSAPRADVFDAWTNPERIVRWFGPDMFPAESFEHDFRPGGRIELCMRGPNGEEARSTGEYVEIVPPERVVTVSWIEGETGRIFEVLQQVTFADRGAQTEVTLEHLVLRNEGFPGASGAQIGWEQTLAKLDVYLAATTGAVG